MIINQKKIDQAIWNYVSSMDDGTHIAWEYIYHWYTKIKKSIEYYDGSIEVSLYPFSVIDLDELNMFKYNNYWVHVTAWNIEGKQNHEYLTITIEDPTYWDSIIDKTK